MGLTESAVAFLGRLGRTAAESPFGARAAYSTRARKQTSFRASAAWNPSQASRGIPILADRGNDLVQVHFFVVRKIPKIVEVQGLISGGVSESKRFFGGNFT